MNRENKRKSFEKGRTKMLNLNVGVDSFLFIFLWISWNCRGS